MYGSRRIVEVRAQLLQTPMDLPVGRRRQLIEESIEEVLRAARQRALHLDEWSASYLGEAIRVLREGRFDDARRLLADALCPSEERSGSPPTGKFLTLEGLMQELKKTKVMRIR